MDLLKGSRVESIGVSSMVERCLRADRRDTEPGGASTTGAKGPDGAPTPGATGLGVTGRGDPAGDDLDDSSHWRSSCRQKHITTTLAYGVSSKRPSDIRENVQKVQIFLCDGS